MNIEELEKIAHLKEKGIITEEEFQKEKRKILSTNPVMPINSNVDVYNKRKVCKTYGKAVNSNTNIYSKYGTTNKNVKHKEQFFVWFMLILIVVIGLGIIGSTPDRAVNTSRMYNSDNISSSQYSSSNTNKKYNSNNSSSSSSLYKEEFTLESMRKQVDEWGLYLHIVGTIKNNRNKRYSYVQVTFNLYDKNGAQLGTAIANINNLDPYGTWRYDAIGLISNVEDVASYKLGEITGF